MGHGGSLVGAARRVSASAQRCQGNTRAECLKVFLNELRKIERKANRSTLVERKLILGVAVLWRDQAKPLIEDVSVQTHFVRVKLRRWHEVYVELERSCPWVQAGDALYQFWQPGRTVVTFVGSLPYADAGRAVELAAVNSNGTCVLVTCDMKRWASSPGGPSPSLRKFCIYLCETVAAKLGAADQLPAAAELGKLALSESCRLLAKLCESTPERCIVLSLENAHLLVSSAKPWPNGDCWLEQLGRLEQQIHNLALTIPSRGGEAAWRRLQTGLQLPVEPPRLLVRMLSRRGADQWLRLQFDAAGVYFNDSGLERVYRLTGGHPRLLAVLSDCVAILYNNLAAALPAGPIIDASVVDMAAERTQYKEMARRFSRALAADLGRRVYDERRLMLFLLARINVVEKRAANVDEHRGQEYTVWNSVAGRYTNCLHRVVEKRSDRRRCRADRSGVPAAQPLRSHNGCWNQGYSKP